MKQVYDIFTADPVDPGVKKSAAEQLGIMMQGGSHSVTACGGPRPDEIGLSPFSESQELNLVLLFPLYFLPCFSVVHCSVFPCSLSASPVC